jgi:hypothetical protein
MPPRVAVGTPRSRRSIPPPGSDRKEWPSVQGAMPRCRARRSAAGDLATRPPAALRSAQALTWDDHRRHGATPRQDLWKCYRLCYDVGSGRMQPHPPPQPALLPLPPAEAQPPQPAGPGAPDPWGPPIDPLNASRSASSWAATWASAMSALTCACVAASNSLTPLPTATPPARPHLVLNEVSTSMDPVPGTPEAENPPMPPTASTSP